MIQRCNGGLESNTRKRSAYTRTTKRERLYFAKKLMYDGVLTELHVYLGYYHGDAEKALNIEKNDWCMRILNDEITGWSGDSTGPNQSI
ncbi:hypothetical protein IC619_000675 [Hazenella sp. IB182353]|uniref:hypothetical protein n=1 Tax=Polycladospora coralii TaxID=2771432 RepID=UPI00174765D9|nr:hypothetical protein [Polycladospora coralii]MBS7529005.1 hypothetical protein [Polycladospora coralii]